MWLKASVVHNTKITTPVNTSQIIIIFSWRIKQNELFAKINPP